MTKLALLGCGYWGKNYVKTLEIMPNIDLKEISLDRILDLKNNKIFEYSNELKESLRSLDIKEDKKEKVSLVLQKVLDGTLKSLIDEYTKIKDF